MLRIQERRNPLLLQYPTITDHQAELMLHAIGADHRSERKYLDMKYYHAYRNYYDAGGKDIEIWNDLVDKGLAEKGGHFYHVTVYGLNMLEKLTGSVIYDDYECVGDCKTIMLEKFMKNDVYCGYGNWFPTSAKSMAVSMKIPVSLARETARYLEKQGYIQKGHYGGIDDEGFPYCVHGYYLTDKARKLERWQVLYDQEMAYLNRTLNEDTTD